MASAIGLQQLTRTQGIEWGDSGRGAGDTHLWMADHVIYTDAALNLAALSFGSLTLTDAAAKIVPGATSLLFRNNVDGATNMTITDAGNVTVNRGSLTFASSSIPAASSLILTDAKVIPDDVTRIFHVNVNSAVTSNGSTNPALSSNDYTGVSSTPTLSGTSGLGHFTAVSGVSTFSGTGQTQVHFGTTGRVYLTGAGNVVELIGLYGTANISGSGTVSSHVTGLEIHNFNETQGSATIVEAYGINIPAMLVGTAFTPPSSLNVTSMAGIQIGQPLGATQNNLGLVIGDFPSVGNHNNMILAQSLYTDPAETEAGVVFSPIFAATTNNTQDLTGMNLTIATTNTAFNYGTVRAAYAITSLLGSGTVTSATGIYAQTVLRNTGGASGGHVTSAYGIRAIVMNLGNEVTPGVIATSRVINVESPAFGSTGTITNQYGIDVQNQGHAQVTGSSWGVRVEIQSGATARSYALETLGGEVKFTPTETVASASGALWNGVFVPATTLTLSGSTAQTGGIGVHLMTLTAPTYNTGAVFAVKDAATLAILGPPVIGTGGGSITNPRALWVVSGIAQFGGLVQTVLSATGGAGLNLPHGAAPTSPVDGDVWTTTAGIFCRINGVTKTITIT